MKNSILNLNDGAKKALKNPMGKRANKENKKQAEDRHDLI